MILWHDLALMSSSVKTMGNKLDDNNNILQYLPCNLTLNHNFGVEESPNEESWAPQPANLQSFSFPCTKISNKEPCKQ